MKLIIKISGDMPVKEAFIKEYQDCIQIHERNRNNSGVDMFLIDLPATEMLTLSTAGGMSCGPLTVSISSPEVLGLTEIKQ